MVFRSCYTAFFLNTRNTRTILFESLQTIYVYFYANSIVVKVQFTSEVTARPTHLFMNESFSASVYTGPDF